MRNTTTPRRTAQSHDWRAPSLATAEQWHPAPEPPDLSLSKDVGPKQPPEASAVNGTLREATGVFCLEPPRDSVQLLVYRWAKRSKLRLANALALKGHPDASATVNAAGIDALIAAGLQMCGTSEDPT